MHQSHVTRLRIPACVLRARSPGSLVLHHSHVTLVGAVERAAGCSRCDVRGAVGGDVSVCKHFPMNQ